MVSDPLVLLQLGEMRCGHVARVAVDLFSAAGYQARLVQLGAHVIAEVYYGQNWHYFDADMFKGGQCVFNPDGSIPSVDQLSQSPYLIDSLAADLGRLLPTRRLRRARSSRRRTVIFPNRHGTRSSRPDKRRPHTWSIRRPPPPRRKTPSTTAGNTIPKWPIRAGNSTTCRCTTPRGAADPVGPDAAAGRRLAQRHHRLESVGRSQRRRGLRRYGFHDQPRLELRRPEPAHITNVAEEFQCPLEFEHVCGAYSPCRNPTCS